MSDEATPASVAPQGGAQAPADPGGPQYTKVVIDGVEEEVDLDTLKKHYGLDKASYKRFQQAAAKEREVQATLAELAGDDDAVFRYLKKQGKDPVKAAERLLTEELRRQSLSPEEQQREQARAELEELHAQREEARREYESYREQQEAARYYDEYARTIPQAITAAGIPQELTQVVLPLVARRMEDAVINGYDLDARTAAHQARQEVTQLFRSMAKSLPPDKLAEMLGKEGVAALRKHDLERLQQPGQRVARGTNVRTNENPGRRPKKSWSDVFGDD